MMRDFILVLNAEWLKLRRSLLLRVSVLVPVFYVLFEFIGAIRRDSLGINPGVNFWAAITEAFSKNWLFLLYPLIITLQTALMGELEKRNNTWKLIFSQPRSRWKILAAKQLIAFLVSFLSLICLILGMVVFGFLIRTFKPEIHVDEYIPFAQIGWFFLVPFLNSLLVISIQTWISLNWGNFVVSCSTGIVSTLTTLFIFGQDYARYFPWTFPAEGMYKLIGNEPVWITSLTNLIFAAGVSLLSNLTLSRKEIN